MDVYAEDWTPGEGIAADTDGSMLRQVQNALLDSRGRLKAILDKGVSPADFQKGEALLSAYDAAMRGMEKSWNRRHKN